jgi:Ulp1 family protease
MRCIAPLVVVLLISGIVLAQEKPQAPPEQKNPVYVSPSARLAAAKTVFMKNNGGSETPFNVISGGLEGWARFVLVDSPEQADIVIEVTSPDDDHSSQSTSKTKVGAQGRMEDSASSRPANEGPIKMVVSDARTHLTLWAASDQPKGGFRQRARDEHLVEAAQRLITKFRERIEPPPAAK